MRRGLLAAVLGVLLLTGCGVPQDDEPRALEPQDVPFASAGPSAVADPEGTGRVGLYFVRDGQVVPTSRRVEHAVTTPELVRLLFRGPAPPAFDDGLGSVIPATLSVDDVAVRDGTAVVTLAGPRSEVRLMQPLAYAQIVATLTPQRVDGVRFRLDGRDLRVPRGDGSLTSVPLRRDDYAQLLVPSPAPAVPTPSASAPSASATSLPTPSPSAPSPSA